MDHCYKNLKDTSLKEVEDLCSSVLKGISSGSQKYGNTRLTNVLEWIVLFGEGMRDGSPDLRFSLLKLVHKKFEMLKDHIDALSDGAREKAYLQSKLILLEKQFLRPDMQVYLKPELEADDFSKISIDDVTTLLSHCPTKKVFEYLESLNEVQRNELKSQLLIHKTHIRSIKKGHSDLFKWLVDKDRGIASLGKAYIIQLLFEKDDLSKMNVLRRIISPMGTMDGIEFLIAKLKNTKNNSDFFESMNKSAN